MHKSASVNVRGSAARVLRVLRVLRVMVFLVLGNFWRALRASTAVERRARWRFAWLMLRTSVGYWWLSCRLHPIYWSARYCARELRNQASWYGVELPKGDLSVCRCVFCRAVWWHQEVTMPRPVSLWACPRGCNAALVVGVGGVIDGVH